MPKDRKYYTGLLTFSDEPRRGRYVGRGWEASIGIGHTERRSCFGNPVREIVIKAASAHAAQNGLNLIKTAHGLLNNAPDMTGGDYRVIPCDPSEREEMYHCSFPIWPASIQTYGFPDACKLAARASRKRSHSYALSLYHVSQTLHANHPMELHDDLRSSDIRSAAYHDHVRLGYSLIAAYAVLEQLGLALNGPAFDQGEWVPERRAELEGRLTRAGIDLSKPAIWHLRGGRTALERRRKTQPLKKARWARGRIRDEEVAIVDAIADLRWLRSGVAAHDVKDSARFLSVFDVLNAQDLARRCILACLGCEKKNQELKTEDAEGNKRAQ